MHATGINHQAKPGLTSGRELEATVFFVQYRYYAKKVTEKSEKGPTSWGVVARSEHCARALGKKRRQPRAPPQTRKGGRENARAEHDDDELVVVIPRPRRAKSASTRQQRKSPAGSQEPHNPHRGAPLVVQLVTTQKLVVRAWQLHVPAAELRTMPFTSPHQAEVALSRRAMVAASTIAEGGAPLTLLNPTNAAEPGAPARWARSRSQSGARWRSP